jgi:protein arginine kinase
MISFDQLYNVPAWFSGSGTDGDVVLSTRIRLARNLSGHQFPARASLQDRASIFESVTSACEKIPLCKECAPHNLTAIKGIAQQFLVEERAISPDMLTLDGDRGMVANPDRRISIMVNEEDHIRLQVMDAGFCPKEVWETADALDTALGQKVTYAFDRRRGYLTCCPTNAGTGLRVSFLVHLPGLTLTKTVDQVLQAGSQMGIATRGFFGEHSEIVGNLFQLSNQATMGAQESEFLEQTQTLVTQVATLERQARKRLEQDAKAELVDKVYRAFGILKYARSLRVDEFLNLSSALRIGIDMKLVRGMGIQDLNRLTLLIMPAHIQTLYDRAMENDELCKLRAEVVRGFLKQKMDGLE